MKTQSQIEFEEWAKSKNFPLDRYFDMYLSPITEAACQGWLARDSKIAELSEKLREKE